MIKNLILLVLTVAVTFRCADPAYKLSGVVQNGLNGDVVGGVRVFLSGTDISTLTDKNGNFSLTITSSDTPGVSVETVNSGPFLKRSDRIPDLVLIAGKRDYQQLEYPLITRMKGLTLNMLPVAPESGKGDLTGESMPFTSLLDRDVQWEPIIDGIRLFYEKRVEKLKPERERYWNRDFSSGEAYAASVAPNRSRFRSILGAVDERIPVTMEKLSTVAETGKYAVHEVRWTVLKKVVPGPALQDWPELDVPGQIFGEGLLIEPKMKTRGYVIAIPDADQRPEDLSGLSSGIDRGSQFARRLAENGFTVVVPVVTDRTNRWSRSTDRPSRTWIYSQAHEMGRTVTGYEVQKMEAVIDWFEEQGGSDGKIGIAGYGEGGLLAFYTAALNTRVDAAMVSGYFAPREEIWKEPIYRNIRGLLSEFGDAEIASLVTPRGLIIEYSKVPDYQGPTGEGKKIEPPGKLWTHSFSQVEQEFKRISELTGGPVDRMVLVKQGSGDPVAFGSEQTMDHFMNMLGKEHPEALTGIIPEDKRKDFDDSVRMGRMIQQMVGHTQLLLRDSEYVRKDFISKHPDQEFLRNYFRNEMIGWLDDDFLPVNPRTKKAEDQPGYTCFDVLIDVLPDVELWGVLTIPKGIESGEKRPVVVLQHGRGGNPWTAMSTGSYYEVGRKLADMGFVVFTPFGNWTGETRFRWIDRVAMTTKASLWSTVGREHQQLIRWFKTLPFVDPERIGFYGKSIGGQAAVLIPSMLPEYALTISCAYFNESARKESSVYFPTSFVYHVDSEMPMWNRGHTLEYAEMAMWLIFPRPFMVEHGKQDGIAPPGWVEYEYTKVKRFYDKMGKGDLTEIDLHEGGHIINGAKSYPFLQKHLKWPASQ